MKTNRFLALAAVAASGTAWAGSTSDRTFAPPACDFSATFPIAPEIKSLPKVAQGHVVTSAQTPGNYLPWLVAECTEMQSGTTEITAEYRESKNQAMLARMHVGNIKSKSTHEPTGDRTTTVGDVVIEGRAMRFTKLTIVGSHSMLSVTALEPAKGDQSVKETFFASIVRKP